MMLKQVVLAHFESVHQHPETENGPYLGLCGSKTNSEGT